MTDVTLKSAVSGRYLPVLFATFLLAAEAGFAQQPGQETGSAQQDARQVIQDWPETSSKVAQKMIEQYGEPDGVTEAMLIWQDSGPWVRTIVYKEEIDHRFPVPHKDVLEQYINYEVPEEKFSDLAKYDGSVVAYRTNGELSARCDKEGANFLALNLAHDIVEGNRSVDEARAYYAQTIQQVMQGEQPEYVQDLQFETRSASATADPDEPFDMERMAAAGQEQAAEGAAAGGVAGMSRTELVGKSIVTPEGETAGEITDVTSDQSGQEAAVVEVGGFLGVGARRVALPLSELSLTAEGEVQTTKTQDELEAMPEVDSNEDDIL